LDPDNEESVTPVPIMTTQSPRQADSGEPRTTEAGGDIEMAEESGDLEMTALFQEVYATDGRAYFASILEDSNASDDQHGSIRGCFYSSRIDLFLNSLETDEQSLVSAKGEVDSFFTSILEQLEWIPRSAQENFPITDLLLRKPDETFLRVNHFIAGPSEDEECPNIKYTLQSTPTDLYGTYDCILHRIDSKDRQNSLSVLKWLVFSESPLTLNEMAVATAEARRRRQIKPDVKAMEDLVQVWEPFLVVHEGKVFFVHEKAKEYMKKRGLAAQWLVELAGRRAKRRRVK
jgi:hypothetical protein